MESSEEETISKEEYELIDYSLLVEVKKVLDILDSILIQPTIRYNLSKSDDLVLENGLINDIVNYYLTDLVMALENSKAYLLNDYFMIKEFLDPLKVKFIANDLDVRLKYFKKRIIYDLEEFEMILKYSSDMYDKCYNDLIGMDPNLFLKVNLLQQNQITDFLNLKNSIITKVNSIYI